MLETETSDNATTRGLSSRGEKLKFEEVELPSDSKWMKKSYGHYYCIWKSQINETCKHHKKKFSDRSSLKKHVRTHYKPVLCPARHDLACTTQIAEQRDMLRHVQSEHAVWAEENGFPLKMLSCPHCNKQIRAREDNLGRHLRASCPSAPKGEGSGTQRE